MSDEMTLLPCPFCGGEADISDEGEGTEPYRFWAYCTNGKCFVEGTPAFETENEAIEAWNTRAERPCECGWRGFVDSWGYEPPNFCPRCGGEVVSR